MAHLAPARELLGHDDAVMSVAWSPNGAHLASASVDRTVRVWETSSGRMLVCCQGHTGEIRDVAFSPDGARLAMAADQTVRVLEVSSRQELGHLPGPYPASPGGDLVACWPIPGFGQRGSHHPALGGDAWRLA